MAEDVRSAGANDVTVTAHILALREEDRRYVDVLDKNVDQRLKEMDLRYQQRFDSQQKALEDARISAKEAVEAALSAAKEAVNKAEVASTRRFDSQNEFREQLADQAATFLPRNEYNTAHGSLVEKVNDVSARIDRSEGSKQGGIDARTFFLGSIGAIAAVVGIWIATH